MLLHFIFIIIGIILVLWGADRLTEGSVAVAERLNIPQIVIGLTIVAMGTSMPEFCVSLIQHLKELPTWLWEMLLDLTSSIRYL